VSDSRYDRLRLRGPADDGSDEIRIRTEVSSDNDEAFRYRIDYYPDKLNNSSSKTEFTVKVMNPIQFRESGQTPGYQPSEDTEISSPRGTPAPLQTQASDGSFFTWTTNFTNSLGMRGYLVDSTSTLPDSSQELSADELKFDLWIESLTWAAEATHVAFHLKIECESDDIDISRPDADRFVIGPTLLGGPDGFFSWDTTVNTFNGTLNSGNAVPVDLVVTEFDKELYYTVGTVDRPLSVMWDPLAGLDVVTSSGLSTGAILGIVFAVLVSLGGAAFMYRRYSHQKKERAAHPNLLPGSQA
jgi:hypothetical protein